jgi:hypothetical protein
MKSASIYMRNKRFIVHPWSTTLTGLLIATEPFIVLDGAVSPEDLGKAICHALDSAASGLPYPERWLDIDKPLLSAAGVKSWKAFVKQAACCLTLEKDKVIEIVPQKNLGTRDGFQDTGLQRTTIAIEAGYRAIGEAAVTAMAEASGP